MSSGKKEQYQAILKAVNLPTVPHDQCQNALRTTQLGKYFKLHKSFMCAGGVDGIDTCTVRFYIIIISHYLIHIL